MNIYHGLLFQHGHVGNVGLARLLSGQQAIEPAPDSQAAIRQAPAKPRRAPVRSNRPLATRLRWLFEELILLGGRPVSKDRNDDLNDPFPPLHPCH